MSERRGCFKFGCLGCLALGALVALVIVVLLVLGLVTGGAEQRFEPVERAHALPVAEGVGSPPPSPEAGQPVGREIEVEEPGRIVLDVSRGEFEIVPGPPGERIRLEGRYDAGRFALEERYESYGEAGWIYHLRFDRRGVGLRLSMGGEEGGNRIRLIIPRDTPVALEGRIAIGESRLELGGLWLVGVDLELGVGAHAVSFSEPLAAPLGELRLDTSLGELSVDRVGNASPREVWIRHSAGETSVDLGGAWRRDARVDVTCGVGECDVHIPEEVNVELRRASVTLGESSQPERRELLPGVPTLELSVSATLGQVTVH